jgi:hypothetical protein
VLSSPRNSQQLVDENLSQRTQESIDETPITIGMNKKNKRLPKQALNLSLMSNNKSPTVMRTPNESLSVSDGNAFKSTEVSLQKSLNIEDKIDSIIDTNSEQEVEEYGVENEVVIDSNAQSIEDSVQNIDSINETLNANNIDCIHENNNSIVSSIDNNTSTMSSINRNETISSENSNISEENTQQLNDKNLSQRRVGSVSRKLTKQSIVFFRLFHILIFNF